MPFAQQPQNLPEPPRPCGGHRVIADDAQAARAVRTHRSPVRLPQRQDISSRPRRRGLRDKGGSKNKILALCGRARVYPGPGCRRPDHRVQRHPSTIERSPETSHKTRGQNRELRRRQSPRIWHWSQLLCRYSGPIRSSTKMSKLSLDLRLIRLTV